MSKKVSIIIPSRGERFLTPTVQDVLRKATGDIEVIVVLDGEPPVAPLPEDPRVVVLRHGVSLGMRPAINHATRIATGDYFMKLDGHCMVDTGFDECLVANHFEDNWIVVPRRHSLDAEAWTFKDTGKSPVDAHFLSFPFEDRPGAGLHGTVWLERARTRKHILLDEEMSSQGSCWFMARHHWEQRLGEMDVANYGSFIQEFQEIGLKTWLGGGACMVNKRTWYAHLHKGKTYGRGYFIAKSEQTRGSNYAIRHWMLDLWPRRVHNLRWLIERFAPVPSWPDLDTAFRIARERLS